MKKVIIVDTGRANFLSIKRAVEKYEKNVSISNEEKEIKLASKVILPGIGAFNDSVNYLKKKEIFKVLKEISKDKPIMGICLGMQLLFENSNEHGFCEGLNVIKGIIRPLPIQKIKNCKIPNIGWYNLNLNKNFNYKFPLDLSLDEFYFIHSFYATEMHTENLVAYYNFGNIKVPAIVKNENIMGCQFHPEKSRLPGLNLIKHFLKNKI